MRLSTIALLSLSPLAAGALAGALAGASLAALGVGWQKRLLRRGSAFVMQAFGIAFLVKLVALVGGALLLRFVPGLAAHADWKAYLIAFAASVLCVTALGSLGALRVLQRGAA